MVREGQVSRQVLRAHLSAGQEGAQWTGKSPAHSPLTLGRGHPPSCASCPAPQIPPGTPTHSNAASTQCPSNLAPSFEPWNKNIYVLIWVFNVVFPSLLHVRLTVASVSLLRVRGTQPPARNPQLS